MASALGIRIWIRLALFDRHLWRFASVLAAVVFFVEASASGWAADLSVTQAKLGNIFLTNETVEIPVQTTGDSIDWTARDFFGAQTSGTVKVTSGATVIRPQLGRKGYFDLHLTAKRADAVVAQMDTAFAVLAPADTAAMADSPFGVMTHFAQAWGTDIMPLIAKAGIVHIRDEQYWQQVELTRGAYKFPSSFRNYMAAASANGLNPLLALTFDNSIYDHDPTTPSKAWTPYTDDGRIGYAKYGQAVLSQYGAQVDAVEVWNEYNGTWCVGPAATNRPVYYAAMLKEAYQRIKAARPGVRVFGGAAVLVPLPYFDDLFAAGGLANMDGVVIHPYRDVPEGVEKSIAGLQDSMKRNNQGIAKPIWATECSSANDLEVGRRPSARYLVRLYTLMLSQGVERIYWYLMKDYSGFTTGLLKNEADALGRYAPTATYAAYSNLIQQLYGARPVAREPRTDSRTRLYLFKKDGAEMRVAWTTVGSSQLALKTDVPLTVVTIMGEESTLKPTNGEATLEVNADPVYIKGTVAGVREMGRPEWVVADSVTDFSSAQGATNWSYGYYDTASGSVYNPAAFKPMTWTRGNDYSYQWVGPCDYLSLNDTAGHPGVNGTRPVWAVRRWLSYVDGTAQISGALSAVSNLGDGVLARIMVDGKEVYSAMVGGVSGPPSVAYNVSVTLAKGSLVDFIITPGAGSDSSYDAVNFNAQITMPTMTADAWKRQHFNAAELSNPAISGDEADPNLNGFPNLLDYALGLNPHSTSGQADNRPKIGALTSTDGDAYLTLTFRRALAPADINYQVELTSSLGAVWTPGGVPVGDPINNGDGTETLTFRDSEPIGTTSQRFIRLRVNRSS